MLEESLKIKYNLKYTSNIDLAQFSNIIENYIILNMFR